MREVDFRHLQSALLSLSASTDLVLARGQVKATWSRRCSPYTSHRRVRFDVLERPLGDALLVANYRKVLVVGLTEDSVQQAAEDIGREGRPFEGNRLGWDGPWAQWVVEPVPPTLPLLEEILRSAHEYGLIDHSWWLQEPLLYTGWLVPVVMEWDEDGQPVFLWPDLPGESEPVDPDLPVEV